MNDWDKVFRRIAFENKSTITKEFPSVADDKLARAGFPFLEENEKYIKYYDGEYYFINFDKKRRGTRQLLYYVPLRLHYAIYEKMKELGWLKEVNYGEFEKGRETPLKPKENELFGKKVYVCPNCEHGVEEKENLFYHNRYCGHCGQRLDWEEKK